MNDDSMTGFSPPGPPGERRSVRAVERRRRIRSRRSRFSVLLMGGIVLAAAALAWFTIRPLVGSFLEEDDYPGPGSGRVTVTIPQGASGTAIGKVLREAGVVKSANAFIDVARKDARSAGIRPGVYALHQEMSAAGALQLLLDPANRIVRTTTIKEGQRLTEIIDTLVAETGIPKADFQAALKQPAEIGLPPQAKGRVEGWLFPATYEMSPQVTAADLLSEMIERTTSELAQLGVASEKWNAVIIEASLVEAERGSDSDAPKIARVFANRIAQGWPLQLDTTVNYALNRRRVAVAEKETKINSPYNTYRVKGLPVGAICSPGAVAIKAVLEPAEGPWMYFVAVNPDTGQTKFAVTEGEFFALQAELNKWLAANPGR